MKKTNKLLKENPPPRKYPIYYYLLLGSVLVYLIYKTIELLFAK